MDLNDILSYFKQDDEEKAPEQPQSSWLDLYKKYNEGLNPQETKQVSDAMGSANPIENNPPPSDALMRMVRPMAGVSEQPVIVPPPQAPIRELASEPKPIPKAQPQAPLAEDLHIPPQSQQMSSAEDYQKALLAAQEKQRINQANARIDRGAAQLLGAAGRTKPDYTQADLEDRNAGAPVTELQQKIGVQQLQNKLNDEAEMANPSSATSVMLRKFAEKFGMNLPENVSGKHIKEVAPMIVQAYEADENRKMRLQLAQDNASNKKDLASEKKAATADKETTTRFDKMNSLISAEIKGGRTSLGQDAQGLRAIENAQALLNNTKDMNDLDNRQVYEAARVLDRVLSGGVGGQSSSAHLTPETAKSYVQGLIEKATNQRQGAQLGSFMHSMNDTFSREKDLAEKRVRKTQTKLLGSFKDLKEKDPEKWQTVMTQNGLPQDPFSAPEDKVKVQSPSGEVKLIPKEQLDEALKHGGTLVK